MGQLISRRRASAICTALFFVGLAALAMVGSWWPGIMLAIGLPLALRQFLLGRPFDMCMSLFVFCGVFITVQFDISWQILLPIIFVLAAVYILLREFQENREHPEDIEDEDINHEIEETKKKKKDRSQK